MMNVFNLFFSFLIVFVSSSGWDYSDGKSGPKNWAHHHHLCHGNAQSPIDVVSSKTKLHTNVCNTSNIEWDIPNPHLTTYQLKNNGHTVVVSPCNITKAERRRRRLGVLNVTGDLDDMCPKLKLPKSTYASFPNQFKTFNGINDRFCLDSFHFHWGGPLTNQGSEHTLDGKRFPMEVHFVHYSCDYKGLSDALWATSYKNIKDQYVLGVIGVFFELGPQNEALEKIIDAHSNIQHPTNTAGIDELDIRKLLPKTKEYYAYTGSLTTPPCSPNVRWHLMKNPITMSLNQLKKFQNYMESNASKLVNNYRPIQHNHNPVFRCFENSDEKKTKKESMFILPIVWGGVSVFVLFAFFYVFCNCRSQKNALLTTTTV